MEFKKLLNNANKTQLQLAKEVGVTQALISKWVVGKCQPQLNMVGRLAEVLHCTVEDILSCFK